jgi:O-antigen/teichoic acid export membrane protein
VVYHAEIVHVLFGGKFIEHSWLLPLILAFSTINCFATPVSLVAQYEEKAHIQLLSKVFALYNIGALLLMIPYLGIYGAAISSGSAQALKNLYVWWHVRRRAVWINARASMMLSMAMWGGAIALCEFMKKVLPGPSVLQLSIGVVVFAAIGLISIRSAVLCHSDREIILRLIKGRETRILTFLGVLNPPPHLGAQGHP